MTDQEIERAVKSGQIDAFDGYLLWLSARPPAVRAVLAKWPPGSRIDGKWVMGANERGGKVNGLLVSAIDPNVDYDAAFAGRYSIPLPIEEVE